MKDAYFHLEKNFVCGTNNCTVQLSIFKILFLFILVPIGSLTSHQMHGPGSGTGTGTGTGTGIGTGFNYHNQHLNYNSSTNFGYNDHKDQPQPIIDCVLTEWGPWSPCTRTCGHARKERRRMIKLNALNGGKKCDKKLTQRRRCKDNPPCGESNHFIDSLINCLLIEINFELFACCFADEHNQDTNYKKHKQHHHHHSHHHKANSELLMN